jgi:vacuolar protein 8
VQFQAVGALRGLATHQTIRMQLVREGALEPLILAASTDSVEVQREVAATLCNLALAEENKVTMARSGVLPALVALAQSRDKERETHAVACLANLAEMVEGRTQRRMLDDGCLRPLLNLATSQDAEVAAHEDERARAAVLSTAFFAWRAHLFGHTDAWNRTNPRGELRLVLTILWRA